MLEKNNRLLIPFTYIAAFTYLFIVSLQGFDLCDEGWCLSFYQQFFKNPDSAQYQFMYYLSGFVGGVWEVIFGAGGILSFRLLNAIVILSIVYFIYKITKEYINPIVFCIATFYGLLLIKYGNIVFHHNYFTALLVAISIYFLYRGIINNSYSKLFFGGLFIGLCFFARVANLTMLSLGLLFLINFFYDKNWKQFSLQIITGLAGCLLGIAIIIGIMIGFGHFDIFIECLNESLFSAGNDEQSNHQMSKMIHGYVKSYMNIFHYLLFFLFVFSGFIYLCAQLTGKKQKIILAVLLFLLLCLQRSFNFIPNNYAFILLPILISLYKDRHDKKIILLNSAAIIVMFFMPLGSDSGISNIGKESSWLGVFMAFIHYFRFAMLRMKKGDWSGISIVSISLIVFSIFSFKHVALTAYFDQGNRLKKTYKIENKLATVYTTKAKSEKMTELLGVLNNYVKSGDTLFCFESLPTINYLTETVPFGGTSWVWVYDPSNFERNIIKWEKKSLKMPVVLRQKCQPIQGEWLEFDKQYNDTTINDYFYKKDRIISFNKFLTRHGYQIKWENELFQILVPSN